MASSIGPLLPGRIPGSLQTSRLVENINRDTRILLELEERVATGQSFFRPGESPAAALRTIVLQKELEQNKQFKTNLVTDRSFLEASETALQPVADAVIKAQGLALAGIGDTVSDEERMAMSQEVTALIRSVLNSANTLFRGRYLFAGSETGQLPFELTGSGLVEYRGDQLTVDSYLNYGLVEANSIDGHSAFNVLTSPVGADIDPALTLQTRIRDLLGGQGVELGSIRVTADNGAPIVKTVDLSAAETVGDIKTILEDAFAAEAVTLTVDVDPATNYGIRITPSAGTVSVTEVDGGRVASDLGIGSAAVAQITGADLDPAVTELTELTALNGGTGIGATAGNGLMIRNGQNINQVVDLTGATTVQDVMNLLGDPDLGLSVGLNSAGNGLAVSSRLSGASFSIGENNGSNAANLGILTFSGATLLSEMNYGLGVPVDEGIDLEITRRDGTDVAISLAGDATVQDVLDSINAVDPGNLVASLNAVGNGVSLLDNSGVGPLTVGENVVSVALGMNGAETGADNTVPLVGVEVNYDRSDGAISLLTRLEAALAAGDDLEIGRASEGLKSEFDRFNLVRGELGSRLRVVDTAEEALLDQEFNT